MMTGCAACGKGVDSSQALLTGDGAVCNACYYAAKARDDHRAALADAGVSQASLDAAQNLGARRCPTCREYSMRVTHVTHHVTKSFGGIVSSSSGRTEQYTCVRCGHGVEIESFWRFLWQTFLGVTVGPVMLVGGTISAVSDPKIWTIVFAVLGLALTAYAIVGIVARVRHPAA